jgi:hypothetical protein
VGSFQEMYSFSRITFYDSNRRTLWIYMELLTIFFARIPYVFTMSLNWTHKKLFSKNGFSPCFFLNNGPKTEKLYLYHLRPPGWHLSVLSKRIDSHKFCLLRGLRKPYPGKQTGWWWGHVITRLYIRETLHHSQNCERDNFIIPGLSKCYKREES